MLRAPNRSVASNDVNSPVVCEPYDSAYVCPMACPIRSACTAPSLHNPTLLCTLHMADVLLIYTLNKAGQGRHCQRHAHAHCSTQEMTASMVHALLLCLWKALLLQPISACLPQWTHTPLRHEYTQGLNTGDALDVPPSAPASPGQATHAACLAFSPTNLPSLHTDMHMSSIPSRTLPQTPIPLSSL